MWMEVTTSPCVVHLLNETIVLLPKSHFWSVFRLRPQLLFKIPSFSCWTRLLTVNLSPPLSGRVSDSRPAKLRRGDRSFLRARPLPSFRISPNIRNSLKHTHHRPQTSYAFGKLLRQGTIHNLYEFRLKRKLIQSAAFGYKTL